MAVCAHTLYGTTSESGSVPSAGPTYSAEGKLILSKSFNDFATLPDVNWFNAGLRKMLSEDDYVESWGVWDCYTQDWADLPLTLYRFEMFDLVIRECDGKICTWRGAIDTHGRLLPSLDPEECEEKCWQWLRKS